MTVLALYCVLVIGPPLLAFLVTEITAGPRSRAATRDDSQPSDCIFRDYPPSPWLPEERAGSLTR